MKIRNATIKDLDQLKKVRSSLTDDQIKERLKNKRDLMVDWLVIEENDELVGFVLLKRQGKETHPDYPDMEDLFIKETHRGKGFGTKLIQECERLVREKGFKKIGLAVNPTLNKITREYYEKLGYKHDGKEQYLDGVYNGTEDWVIDLEKEIQP